MSHCPDTPQAGRQVLKEYTSKAGVTGPPVLVLNSFMKGQERISYIPAKYLIALLLGEVHQRVSWCQPLLAAAGSARRRQQGQAIPALAPTRLVIELYSSNEEFLTLRQITWVHTEADTRMQLQFRLCSFTRAMGVPTSGPQNVYGPAAFACQIALLGNSCFLSPVAGGYSTGALDDPAAQTRVLCYCEPGADQTHIIT
jgi:hypothetical protein